MTQSKVKDDNGFSQNTNIVWFEMSIDQLMIMKIFQCTGQFTGISKFRLQQPPRLLCLLRALVLDWRGGRYLLLELPFLDSIGRGTIDLIQQEKETIMGRLRGWKGRDVSLVVLLLVLQ